MVAEAARERRTLDYGKMVLESPTDFRIRSSVYVDPQIFEDEMQRIFENTWIYVAHESEIAAPGDYVTTYMGRQPVILTRGQDNEVHALLNVCRHRGNTICREERGNASFFKCAYHGWVYKNSGELVGISERRYFPDNFDADIQGLLPVPRVGVYRGLIFASLNPDVPSLEDHLGPTRKYIDLWAELSPTGKIKLLEPHKFLSSSNWKFHVENTTEGYHARFVHESAFNTLKRAWGEGAKDYSGQNQDGRAVGLPYGHGVMERPGMTSMQRHIFAEYLASLTASYGEERAKEITYGRNLTIFPNLALLENDIRVVYPISAGKTEVYSSFFQLEGVPDVVNQDNLRDSQWRRGSMGLINTDDLEIFASNQAGANATAMGWVRLSKGIESESMLPEGERLGGHIHDETAMRAMYREWKRLMCDGKR